MPAHLVFSEGKRMDESQKTAQGVLKASTIMAISNLVASVLGFARNIIISSIFGMGIENDAYISAFTIPDFIYTILVGGALSTAFIPIFSVYIATGKKEEGLRMGNTVLNLVAILAMGFCLLGEIFAPQLVNTFMQFEGEAFTLTVKLTRIMFFQCFFMCLTGVCMGIMQSYKNFVPSALGSIYYNVAIVVFGVLLSQVFGLGIAGFSISVVIGAMANLAAHIRPMYKVGFRYQRVLDLKQEGIRKFFRMLGPVLLGLSVNHINLLVNQYFASGLGDSTVSSMKNAQSISQLPVLIFGSTISLSIFPTMSEHYATGNMEEYRRDFSLSFRTVFFLTIPAALGIVALRTPLIRAMYLQGNFKVSDIAMMAGFMLIYSIGTIGYSEQLVLNRAFFSTRDTKTPMLINVACLLLNVVFSIVFVRLWGANGLALAFSAAGIASMIMLAVFLKKRVKTLNGKEILVSSVKTMIASVAMFLVLFFAAGYLEKVLPLDRKYMQLIEVGGLFVVGVVVFFIVAALLKMREVEAVKSIFMRKFKK